MKRGTKITLIVLGSLLALGVLVFIGADVTLSYLAKKQVDKALAALPPQYGEASCGLIQVRLFSGTAEVNDLHFSYRGESVSKKDSTRRPGVDIHVDRLAVGRFFYSVLLDHRVLVSDIWLVRPSVEVWLDDNHPETCFPQLPKDEKLDSVHQADSWLERAELMQFHLKNADVRLHSLRTKLDLAVDSCSLTVNDLAYNLRDSLFSYNDSVYKFSLGHAEVLLPDGRMRIETNDVAHRDQGPLTLGTTRIANTMPRKKLGDLVKEPVTWMDMTLESVATAPFNPIRKALKQDLTLTSLDAVVKRMDVFRDERYAPKEPFDMPQKILMAIPLTFRIDHVNAAIKQIDIELSSTNINCGELHLKGIKATVDNISNKRNNTMKVKGSCPVEQGKADAEMTMTMNNACDFSLNLHATDVNAGFLNPFIRPLIGITFACQVDTLDTRYTGDKLKAAGTFRLLYHGLNVKVHKEDNIPYKIVTRNADTFTTLANTLIPKSNPTAVDIHPRAYNVEWKRDEWKPVPLYLFGPCIDGAKKTMLPGLYVHKQAKSGK